MTKKILITGATGDIGSNLCEFIAKKHAKKIEKNKEGYHLIITARNVNNLKALADKLKQLYRIDVEYFATDFAEQTTFKELVNAISEDGLDGLVVMPPRPNSSQLTIPGNEELEAMLKVSLLGPLRLIADLLPALGKPHCKDITKFSRVVLVSGMSSVQPINNGFMYNTLRTAWLGPMKTLADSYGPKGIIFNTSSFGQVLTESFLNRIAKEAEEKHQTREEILASKVENVPLKKYASLGSVVKGIHFFLKSEGGESITGENIVFANGFTRSY